MVFDTSQNSNKLRGETRMAYKKSAETKEKIIQATEKLLIEKGYYETSIKDISKEANIRHSLIYYYFKNKETIAREIFDLAAEKIIEGSRKAKAIDPDSFTTIIITYILNFKYLALNKATQAVYYDMVRYSDYDKANLERITRTYFSNTKDFFGEYGIELSDKQITAYILTSEGFAKAMFKGIINNLLDFTLEEAMDYFCRHMILSDIRISEAEYQEKMREAFRISEVVSED